MVKQIKTDGKTIGVVALLLDKNEFLTDPRGLTLYRNLSVLKSALSYAGYTDSHNFVVFIKVDEILVEISKCRVTDIGYIFYHEGDKYYVEEDRERRICSIGYIQFPDDNYKRNFTDIFSIMMKMGMRKASWSVNNKVMRFKLTNNTGAINVCTISTLVDINNKRKEKELKAIPFIKEKKNNNLVVFSDKDIYDKRYVEEEVTNKIFDIVAMMDEIYGGISYEAVDFKSTIFYND